MRSVISVCAAACVGLAGQIAGPAMAGEQDFRLVNRTGYQIDNVYVGPSTSRSWGRDVMGRDALPNGRAVKITFPRGATHCHFDIKVKYHDNSTAEWSRIDLCKFETVSLYWDGRVTRAVTE